ncbi:MAG: hypothetical protein IJ849_01325 [Selenomonadaceae bacterium]|nr:hypothetical protein [Selenomonadaceae bacterium]
MKVLAVDIDGTYIRYACMEDTTSIRQRGKIFTPKEGRDVSCPFHVPPAEVVTAKFRHDANLIGALQCYLADPS